MLLCKTLLKITKYCLFWWKTPSVEPILFLDGEWCFSQAFDHFHVFRANHFLGYFSVVSNMPLACPVVVISIHCIFIVVQKWWPSRIYRNRKTMLMRNRLRAWYCAESSISSLQSLLSCSVTSHLYTGVLLDFQLSINFSIILNSGCNSICVNHLGWRRWLRFAMESKTDCLASAINNYAKCSLVYPLACFHWRMM